MAEALIDPRPAAPDFAAADWPRPPRTIVALPALFFVVPSLIFMLIAVIGGWFWALEFGHVAYGAAWTIFDLFLGFVLGPILGRMPVRARLELITRLMPQMILILPTLVLVTLVCGFQLSLRLGTIYERYADHEWILASFAIVGVMNIVALGVNAPTNLAVLFELRKPEPNLERIGRLMKRFIYSAGILGLMQVATLIIMARLAV
jgi:hypothetical protein